MTCATRRVDLSPVYKQHNQRVVLIFVHYYITSVSIILSKMQLTSLSVLLFASASAMASPILMKRQEEQQQSFAITAPVAQDIIATGHA